MTAYCYRHHGTDSDGDGECGKRATATSEMRKVMLLCVFDPADLHDTTVKIEGDEDDG